MSSRALNLACAFSRFVSARARTNLAPSGALRHGRGFPAAAHTQKETKNTTDKLDNYWQPELILTDCKAVPRHCRLRSTNVWPRLLHGPVNSTPLVRALSGVGAKSPFDFVTLLSKSCKTAFMTCTGLGATNSSSPEPQRLPHAFEKSPRMLCDWPTHAARNSWPLSSKPPSPSCSAVCAPDLNLWLAARCDLCSCRSHFIHYSAGPASLQEGHFRASPSASASSATLRPSAHSSGAPASVDDRQTMSLRLKLQTLEPTHVIHECPSSLCQSSLQLHNSCIAVCHSVRRCRTSRLSCYLHPQKTSLKSTACVC